VGSIPNHRLHRFHEGGEVGLGQTLRDYNDDIRSQESELIVGIQSTASAIRIVGFGKLKIKQ
jgi:hypothetical protein